MLTKDKLHNDIFNQGSDSGGDGDMKEAGGGGTGAADGSGGGAKEPGGQEIGTGGPASGGGTTTGNDSISGDVLSRTTYDTLSRIAGHFRSYFGRGHIPPVSSTDLLEFDGLGIS
jgi:hypothetical protein